MVGITHYTLLRKGVCQRGIPFGNPGHYFGPTWPEVVSIHRAETTAFVSALCAVNHSAAANLIYSFLVKTAHALFTKNKQSSATIRCLE